VELVDDWPSSSFAVVEGSVTSLWDKIDAGKQVSHQIVLQAKNTGVFHASRANVTFSIVPEEETEEDTDEEYHEAASSAHGVVQVVSQAEFKRRTGSLSTEWTVLAVLVAFVTLVPFISSSRAHEQLIKGK
jgi:hypothetical protein